MSASNNPLSTGSRTTNLSVPAKARLKRELSRLQTDPPPGIAAYLKSEDDMSLLVAELMGPEESPFEDGIFLVSIRIPARYPFEPPQCRFVGEHPPYHPNIDTNGRICLDTLKSPPAGTWSPAVSLPSLLLSLRSLLVEPNPDDGLEPEISNLYKNHPEQWHAEAQRRTRQHNHKHNETTTASAGEKRQVETQLLQEERNDSKRVKES